MPAPSELAEVEEPIAEVEDGVPADEPAVAEPVAPVNLKHWYVVKVASGR